MSGNLFRSKQYKSKKNLRKLLISSPVSNEVIFAAGNRRNSSQSNKEVVVLVAKYDFEAHGPQELSVRAHEHLKLIDRPGNGWLKVQGVEDLKKTGLVPASYMDIAMNDAIKPVSLEWLNEYRSKVTQEEELEHPYPKVSKIQNVLQNSAMTFWYRIDLEMSNHEVIHLGKYYDEFCKLHASLMKAQFENLPKLPNLVGLFKSIHPEESKGTVCANIDRKHILELMDSCKQLDTYFKCLVMERRISKSTELLQFITDSHQSSSTLSSPSDCNSDIDELIYPHSVNVKKLMHSSSFYSKTEPLPPIKTDFSALEEKWKIDALAKKATSMNLGDKNKLPQSESSNSLMSYSSLIEGYENDELTFIRAEPTVPRISDFDKDTNPVFANSPTSLNSHYSTTSESSEDSIFSKTHKGPTTNLEDLDASCTSELNAEDKFHFQSFSPSKIRYTKRSTRTIYNTSSSKSDVKIKVYLNNPENDIVIYRFKKTNLISIDYLKKMLSYKIFKDSTITDYKLGVKDNNEDFSDSKLLQYLKSEDKVYLNLLPVRK